MVKTKVSRDITNEQCRTPSGRINEAVDVAIHTRATFCTDEWLREHAYMQINEIVVMYLDTSEIERPRVPPSISPLEGIQSLYSFFMLGDGQLLARQWSCWCPACARVRGVSSLKAGWGGVYGVPECMRRNLTVWRSKPKLTSTAAAGIANAREFGKELWGKLRGRVQPRKFGAVQADALWSESERRHLRPGHFWMFEFGDAGGDKGGFLESFKLAARSWKLFEGTRFYDGEAALCVKRWFHRWDGDASGCTFVEWDPVKDAKAGAPPVAMMFNSTKLRAVFGVEDFKKIMPPALDLGVAGGTRGKGAHVQQLEGVGPTLWVLRTDKDEETRDACIRAGSVLQ